MKKEYTQLDSIQRSQLEILLKNSKLLLDVSAILNISRQTLYRELPKNSTTESRDLIGIKSLCIHFLECYKGKTHKNVFCPHNCVNYTPRRQLCLKKYPIVRGL